MSCTVHPSVIVTWDRRQNKDRIVRRTMTLNTPNDLTVTQNKETEDKITAGKMTHKNTFKLEHERNKYTGNHGTTL